MAHRTIKQKVHEGYLQEEGTLTAVAVWPGQLLERTSAGTFQKHSTAGGPAEMLICVEDEIQGKEVTDGYTASSRVTFIAAQKGDVFNVRASNADSSGLGTIGIGDFLESDGAGGFRIWSYTNTASDSSGIVANNTFPLVCALEAIDMADSSGVHGSGLISARVL